MPDQPAAGALDHLVWAAEDLDAGVRSAARRLGVRAAPGGTHPGMGTRNALLGLGLGRYLEVLAPDPAQAGLRGPVAGWVPGSGTGRLVRWAARSGELDRLAAAAGDAGLAVTGPLEMTRDRPGAARLAWRILFLDDRGPDDSGPKRRFRASRGEFPDDRGPDDRGLDDRGPDDRGLDGQAMGAGVALGPLLPFFIDWGGSPHPSELAPAGCTLEHLRGEHPDPARAAAVLATLGVTLPVTAGDRPLLRATIRIPSGTVELA